MRRRKDGDKAEDNMAGLLDNLTAFEDFQAEVLPKIREMLKQGKSALEIAQFAEAYAAARVATIALTDADTGRALAAAKDLQDRATGKAKERVETTHKFEKLKDQELDALLASRLQDAADDEESVSH